MTEFTFPKNPSTPQPPTPPMQQIPPRRNTGLKVLLVLSILLLLISLAGNFLLLLGIAVVSGGGMGDSAMHVQTEVVERGKGGDQIAIMPLTGVVDGNMVQRAQRFANYVRDNKNIKAVIVEVDSPGGSVTASDEIHHILTKVAQDRRLVVSMRGLAASGGYYISMPAEKIYAQPTTLTGSIGVIMQTMEVTRLMDKIGVQPETVKSDNAETFKDAGSPFRKFSEQDRLYFKGLINDMHTKFSKIVEDGRRGKLTKDIKDIAIGRIWTADEARALGLVDSIAYLDQVIEEVTRDAGLSSPTVVRLEKRMSLMEALTMSGGAPRTVEVKIDPTMLEQIKGAAPVLEYRYEGPQIR